MKSASQAGAAGCGERVQKLVCPVPLLCHHRSFWGLHENAGQVPPLFFHAPEPPRAPRQSNVVFFPSSRNDFPPRRLSIPHHPPPACAPSLKTRPAAGSDRRPFTAEIPLAPQGGIWPDRRFAPLTRRKWPRKPRFLKSCHRGGRRLPQFRPPWTANLG